MHVETHTIVTDEELKCDPLFGTPNFNLRLFPRTTVFHRILQKILEIGRRGVQIKRFKGLGEMNAKELFETTMNPEKRKLLKVDLNDDNAVDADKMFTILMGDVVEPRRQFIEDNALNVRNLDV